MSNADACLLYSKVGWVPFDGTGDTLDFINTIEARTRKRYTNCQKIIIVELLVQAVAQDWFMQFIQLYMDTITWIDLRGASYSFLSTCYEGYLQMAVISY